MPDEAQRIQARTDGFLCAQSGNDLSTIHVLAVDDEPAALKLLCLIFAAHPFQCTSANNGEEALVALQRQQFDAVVSDLCMPGIGGMELLAEARRRHPHVAFVVTTGVDDLETGVKAMRSGADDYLVKPLSECMVLASLERSLHKRRLEEQVEAYRQHLEATVEERTTQLRRALHQVERGYEDTLQALGAAIDLRDSQTAGHSQRVSRYSVEISRAMCLPDSQLLSIVRGAYLHDIGKLGIPDRILLKPGPLSADERSVMEQHVQIGFDIINGIAFLSEAAEIILTHHERWDGTGYPRGLKGTDIPLGSRIFAVADTVDAMTSDRPYRPALSFEDAAEEIRRGSGRRYEARVADAFLNASIEDWKALRRSVDQSAAHSSYRSKIL